MATAIPFEITRKRRVRFTEKLAAALESKFGKPRWVRAKYLIRQTEKAWLVVPLTTDGEAMKAVWLPKSTVAQIFKDGDEFRLWVTTGWVLHKHEIDKVSPPEFGHKLLPVWAG